MQIEGFWDELERAQKAVREKKTIENTVDEFEGCVSQMEDLKTCIEMAEEAQDEELGEEARREFAEL